MVVKELINLLKKLPSDFQVILSSDCEGNDYSPISGYAQGFYLPKNLFHGNFTDISCPHFNKDQIEKSQNVVVLYPSN